nr:uncharacterized protein LOC118878428 [Drosophila suzukii]XP_036677484.1 uncharacterized protein LOC118878568 [Drosophila suzukii]
MTPLRIITVPKTHKFLNLSLMVMVMLLLLLVLMMVLLMMLLLLVLLMLMLLLLLLLLVLLKRKILDPISWLNPPLLTLLLNEDLSTVKTLLVLLIEKFES